MRDKFNRHRLASVLVLKLCGHDALRDAAGAQP
jgi:hypothetical protein